MTNLELLRLNASNASEFRAIKIASRKTEKQIIELSTLNRKMMDLMEEMFDTNEQFEMGSYERDELFAIYGKLMQIQVNELQSIFEIDENF